MIVASTTFIYVCCATDTWILNLSGFNDIPIWGAWLIALATYICVSFAKIYLGQNYPSDCVLSLPPILLVIALFYMLQWLDTLMNLCPRCLDANGDESFCYYDSHEIVQNNPILLTRQNFELGQSNLLSTIMICLICFILFSIASFYPVELWLKLSYFIPTLLSVYLFKNIMLCPCSENGYRSVYSPLQLRSTPTYPSQGILTFALLFFSYGATWIVNNLLGNRTASLLSYILRTFFFFGILYQTLLTLITVRLILVAQETPANTI